MCVFLISVTNIQNILYDTHWKKFWEAILSAIKRSGTKNTTIILEIGASNWALSAGQFLNWRYTFTRDQTTLTIPLSQMSEYVWSQKCSECNPQVMNNNAQLWIETFSTHTLRYRCTHAQNKLCRQGTYIGVVKGWGGQSLMNNDAWMKSGRICFLKILVRCCSLHLELQWHVENSLSLSFHWTLCSLVLQVVDCALLAPLTSFPLASAFCSTLSSFVLLVLACSSCIPLTSVWTSEATAAQGTNCI